MHAVDTNVIVRYLLGDDPEQSRRARSLIGHEPVFVPRTVVLEAEWVLRAVYGMPAKRVIAALRDFAGLPGVSVEDASLVATAMDWAEGGMDFADALHLAASTGCDTFVTFDKTFARLGTRLRSISVVSP